MDIPKNQKHPSREPDRSGHTAGYDWILWHVEDELSGREHRHVIVWDDGKLVEDTYTRRRYNRRRVYTRQYHHLSEHHPSVRTYLLRKRIRQVRSLSAIKMPFRIEQEKAGDVDEVLRDQQRKERRRHVRRETARFYGKATEQVKSWEMDAWRNMGGDMAQKSPAHR